VPEADPTAQCGAVASPTASVKPSTSIQTVAGTSFSFFHVSSLTISALPIGVSIVSKVPDTVGKRQSNPGGEGMP
jgi:hypothetical protein